MVVVEDNFLILRKVLQSLYHNLDEVSWIVELGARDCNETILFLENYSKVNILTLECNPSMLPVCRNRIRGKERVTLIEKAIGDVNGKLKFYPIDPANTETTWEDGNPGASSLLKASGKYPVEKYAQTEIEVDAIRLDSLLSEHKIDTLDLLWMDIQGAELMALKGLGTRIKDVKIIHTEAEFMEIYSNQALFPEIKIFMKANNFLVAGFTSKSEYSCDVIFMNQRYFSIDEMSRVVNILKSENDSFIYKEDTLITVVKSKIRGLLKRF
jgi:FkbM family methyltransferase